MKNTLALYLIAVGIVVIALQNAGIIPPLKTSKTTIDGPVIVKGSVNVDNTVDVHGSVEVPNEVEVSIAKPLSLSEPVEVRLADTVDVNLSEIVGRQLTESVEGMSIGVASTSNTLIPINWGEVSIERQ